MMALWMVIAGLAYGQALPEDEVPESPSPLVNEAEEDAPPKSDGEEDPVPAPAPVPEDEAEPQSDPDPKSQTEPDSEAQPATEGETEPTTEGEGEGETEPAAEGEGESETEPGTEAESKSETEDQAAAEDAPPPQPDGELELPDLEARKAANIAGGVPEAETEPGEDEADRSAETDPSETDEQASETDEQASETDGAAEGEQPTEGEEAEAEAPTKEPTGPEAGQREKSTTPIVGPPLPKEDKGSEGEEAEAPPADSPIHTQWAMWARAIESQLDVVRGFGPSMLLLMGGLFLLFVAHSVRGLMSKLSRHGVLPRLLDLSKGLIRFVALGAIAAAIIAVTPRVLLPLIPVFASALVITAGASLFLIIPDLIAGFTLLMEGHIRPGTYLRNERVEGVVDWVGIRTTLVIDDDGHEVQIPNRLLVREASTKDNDEWPQHTVNVHIESPLSSAQQRELLTELAKLVPWRAPGALPEVVRTDEDPKMWRVTNRLIDHRFATQHEEALLEMVEEQFGKIA